jgi:hypothetical protein
MVRCGYVTYPQRMYTHALWVNTRSAPYIRCATGSCTTYRRFPSSAPREVSRRNTRRQEVGAYLTTRALNLGKAWCLSLSLQCGVLSSVSRLPSPCFVAIQGLTRTTKVVRVEIRSRIDFPLVESSRSIES